MHQLWGQYMRNKLHKIEQFLVLSWKKTQQDAF
jgi:hypothetical protein